MSTTDDWKRLWWDKTTEPYTVLRVQKRWEEADWYKVYYRNYTKRTYCMIHAKDELGAYVQALPKLDMLKRRSDKVRAKTKEQTNEQQDQQEQPA
jgi:hypothetical protein